MKDNLDLLTISQQITQKMSGKLIFCTIPVLYSELQTCTPYNKYVLPTSVQ